eukprot:4165850-Lingulodinium_polyedra.AAC.1
MMWMQMLPAHGNAACPGRVKRVYLHGETAVHARANARARATWAVRNNRATHQHHQLTGTLATRP